MKVKEMMDKEREQEVFKRIENIIVKNKVHLTYMKVKEMTEKGNKKFFIRIENRELLKTGFAQPT